MTVMINLEGAPEMGILAVLLLALPVHVLLFLLVFCCFLLLPRPNLGAFPKHPCYNALPTAATATAASAAASFAGAAAGSVAAFGSGANAGPAAPPAERGQGGGIEPVGASHLRVA